MPSWARNLRRPLNEEHHNGHLLQYPYVESSQDLVDLGLS